MSQMTSKDRIDALLNGGQLDRTPFVAMDIGAWVAMTEGMTYRQLFGLEDGGASVIAKWLDEMDSDTFSAVSGVFTACLNAFGCPIHIDSIGGTVDAEPCFHDPETEIPLLDKTKIREKLLANDFVQKMLNQTRHMKKLVGERKYLVGDIAGPFSMAAVMVGTSDFVMMLLEEPELSQQLIDYTTDVSAEMFTLLHENGCDIAMSSEPVASGSLISQAMFEEWVVPALGKLKQKLNFYRYFYTHVCGASGSRVKALRDLGVRTFSVDYLVDLDQALTDADGKMVVMGNVNPAGVLLSGSPEDVYQEARECMETAAGRPFILSPGCDLSAKTPLENVKMLSKACRDSVDW